MKRKGNMVRFMRRKKLNNSRGFSLIEVLIAVVIMAIVALPIIKAFSSSALINRNARRVENANTAAVAVAEELKAMNLEQHILKLTDRYRDIGDETQKTENGIYKFHVTNDGEGDDRFYRGVNDEDFYVEVTLDPSDYKNKEDADGTPLNNPLNNINSIETYKFTDISTSENYVLRDILYKWDNDAKGTFRLQAPGFDPVTDAGKISKKVEIISEVKPYEELSDSPDEAKFIQLVHGRITYSLAGYGEPLTYPFKLDTWEDSDQYGNNYGHIFTVKRKDNFYTVTNAKDVKDEEKNKEKYGMKDVYLFYNPYDTDTTQFITGDDGQADINKCKADDKIEITCIYADESGIKYNNIDTYIVQQDTKNNYKDDDTTKQIYLDRKNVSVNIVEMRNGHNSSQIYDSVAMEVYGTIDLSGALNIKGPVSIYSNIEGWGRYRATGGNRGNGITANSEQQNKNYLYTITVNVWLDKESKEDGEEALASFTSTKEN